MPQLNYFVVCYDCRRTEDALEAGAAEMAYFEDESIALRYFGVVSVQFPREFLKV